MPIVAVDAQFSAVIAFAVTCGESTGESAAVLEHSDRDIYILLLEEPRDKKLSMGWEMKVGAKG